MVVFLGFFLYILNFINCFDGILCYYDINYIREIIFDYVIIDCFYYG